MPTFKDCIRTPTARGKLKPKPAFTITMFSAFTPWHALLLALLSSCCRAGTIAVSAPLNQILANWTMNTNISHALSSTSSLESHGGAWAISVNTGICSIEPPNTYLIATTLKSSRSRTWKTQATHLWRLSRGQARHWQILRP